MRFQDSDIGTVYVRIMCAGLCWFMIETEVNDGPGSDYLNASCNHLRYNEIISFDHTTGLKIT